MGPIAFSSYHGLIGFSQGKCLFLCNYDQLKIMSQVNFEKFQPTALAFANGLEILLVGTSIGEVLVYEVHKK